MTSDRLYSIIVPVYNAASTLNRCVDSILAQTYGNFELILVNDGSSDRSAEIIDQYAAQDPRVIAIHKTNGGVSSARNAGLDGAKGEYIAFADADDEVRPEWIKTFIDNIGTADITIQGIEFVGGSTEIKTIGAEESCDTKLLVEKLMCGHILGYLFSKLFRRDIIEAHHIRFDETIRFREDDIFMLEYAKYMKSWTSTEKSNYIYYVPAADKKYGSTATDCTEKVFESLNTIFSGNIPRTILANQAWSVKGAVVNRILTAQSISPILLDAYLLTFTPTKGLRQRVLNFLILNNATLGPIPRTIFHLINR